MIGGMPAFMSELEQELFEVEVAPVYAFSKRESVEEEGNDGETIKKTVFRHRGFVPASPTTVWGPGATYYSVAEESGEYSVEAKALY